jgi:hypothetical protein
VYGRAGLRDFVRRLSRETVRELLHHVRRSVAVQGEAPVKHLDPPEQIAAADVQHP